MKPSDRPADTVAIARVLDAVRAAQGEPDWGPLHASDLAESEHDGWMYVENSAIAGDFYHLAPVPLTTYKHGITRKPLYLDDEGTAYHRTWTQDGNTWKRSASGSARSELEDTGHYDDLVTMGYTPKTAYDDDFKAERSTRLRAAGFGVIL